LLQSAGLDCAGFAPCSGPLALLEARATVNG
jgi:hypothetical protein